MPNSPHNVIEDTVKGEKVINDYKILFDIKTLKGL